VRGQREPQGGILGPGQGPAGSALLSPDLLFSREQWIATLKVSTCISSMIQEVLLRPHPYLTQPCRPQTPSQPPRSTLLEGVPTALTPATIRPERNFLNIFQGLHQIGKLPIWAPRSHLTWKSHKAWLVGLTRVPDLENSGSTGCPHLGFRPPYTPCLCSCP
jgi:hypothetical protein